MLEEHWLAQVGEYKVSNQKKTDVIQGVWFRCIFYLFYADTRIFRKILARAKPVFADFVFGWSQESPLI
jgi:hypothetical protein